MSNEPISEQFSRVGHDWARLDSIASGLEELKSAKLSEWILAEGDIAVNRAEANVKGSQRWREYIGGMVAARTAANHAKIDMEFLRMRHREWVGEDANNRIQARL